MIGIVKKITTTDSREIPWIDEVRYLDVLMSPVYQIQTFC